MMSGRTRTRTSPQSSFDTHMLPNRNQLVSLGRGATVRVSAQTLDTFTDPASTRTHHEYNWRTGQSAIVHANILDSARKNMTRLKVPTVASARTHPEPDYGYGCSVGLSAPAPPMTDKKSKSSRKKAR